MFAQARGRLGDGTDPPPESRLPRWSLVILEVSASTEARSAWVIWPIFSSSVIRLSRSETRCPIGREASRYTSLRVDCAAAALFEAVADGDCRAVRPRLSTAAVPRATARLRRRLRTVVMFSSRVSVTRVTPYPSRQRSPPNSHLTAVLFRDRCRMPVLRAGAPPGE